jgi:hypothetical protein
MEATAEEARLIFDKWTEAAAAVHIRLFSSHLVFNGVGQVRGYNGAAVEFGGSTWFITVPVEGARFAFSDPREVAVASIRERESAQYELGLSVELATGDRIILREMKPSAEKAEE